MTDLTERMTATPRRCGACGNPLTTTGVCKPCVSARAQRWYSENTSRANAQATVVQKARRRFGDDGLLELRRRLHDLQRGLCACCGEPPSGRMGIDWSLDQINDNGDPLLRGKVCKSCKIAINRYIHPSRFRLLPERIDMVETYLRRPWQDPKRILQDWKGNQPLTPLSRTEGLVSWLEGGMQGPPPTAN